jgi:hypothetical protein
LTLVKARHTLSVPVGPPALPAATDDENSTSTEGEGRGISAVALVLLARQKVVVYLPRRVRHPSLKLGLA